MLHIKCLNEASRSFSCISDHFIPTQKQQVWDTSSKNRDHWRSKRKQKEPKEILLVDVITENFHACYWHPFRSCVGLWSMITKTRQNLKKFSSSFNVTHDTSPPREGYYQLLEPSCYQFHLWKTKNRNGRQY